MRLADDRFDFVKGPRNEPVDDLALTLAEAAAARFVTGLTFSESLAPPGGPFAEADEVLTTITLAFLGDPDTIA